MCQDSGQQQREKHQQSAGAYRPPAYFVIRNHWPDPNAKKECGKHQSERPIGWAFYYVIVREILVHVIYSWITIWLT